MYIREEFPSEWAEAQNTLGLAYAKQSEDRRDENLKKAEFHFNNALEIHTKEMFPKENWGTQVNLGNLFFKHEEWERAHFAFTEAIETGKAMYLESYTDVGRRETISMFSQIYPEDAYCLINMQRPAEALLRLEEGKTRLLVEALALSEINISALSETDKESLQQATHAIRELKLELYLSSESTSGVMERDLAKSLSKAYINLNETLQRLAIEYDGLLHQDLGLSELLALVPEGGALVAPLLTRKGSLIFVLPRGIQKVTESNIIPMDKSAYGFLHDLIYNKSDSLISWLTAYFNFRSFHRIKP